MRIREIEEKDNKTVENIIKRSLESFAAGANINNYEINVLDANGSRSLIR